LPGSGSRYLPIRVPHGPGSACTTVGRR
jgi:hypothetical protein